MNQKIHCDLLDIRGVDWDNVKGDDIECIVQTIHSLELMGTKGELFGFVGTTDVNGIVGGFFVIQFPTEFMSYGRDKTAKKTKTVPAERVFFLLLPQSGRILLQNRRFQVLPINMEVVHIKLKTVLSQVLLECGVGPLVSLIPTSISVTGQELLEAYQSSTRVARLRVPFPDPARIPEDMAYYNPQRERNEILRDSRLHDYPKLSGIEIAARRDHDLRETHLGQDLVYAAREKSDFVLKYTDTDGDAQVLRRLTAAKFEFNLDVDAERVSEEALLRVIDILRQEAALKIKVAIRPKGRQLSLFGLRGDDIPWMTQE